MNIGIDISQIVYKGSGVSRFTEGLVNSILNFDQNNNWIFYFSGFRKNLDTALKKKIVKKGYRFINIKLPPTLLSFLNNKLHQKFISELIYKYSSSLDWFISSDWTEPNLNCKKATIIHDLTYIRYPETVDIKILNTQYLRNSWVKKESLIIFADSQSTKNDIEKELKINSNKIIVNYPGVKINQSQPEQIKSTLNKYHLTKPFILSVGKQEPRKNLDRLFEAFTKLNNHEIDLVVVGPKGWKLTGQQPNQYAKNIIFLDYISDEDLSCLYSSCLFFIYPSIWEGFGYPLIEAMKLKAPVACSYSSSLIEIANKSALFFNPESILDIKDKMTKLINNKNLRMQLSDLGIKKAKMFNWENYLKNLISSLENYY